MVTKAATALGRFVILINNAGHQHWLATAGICTRGVDELLAAQPYWRLHRSHRHLEETAHRPAYFFGQAGAGRTSFAALKYSPKVASKRS